MSGWPDSYAHNFSVLDKLSNSHFLNPSPGLSCGRRVGREDIAEHLLALPECRENDRVEMLRPAAAIAAVDDVHGLMMI